MENLERLFKVLGEKNRIRIIKLLEKRKMCVCELAPILGITGPSISRHMKILKSIGLVGEEQDGFWTNYFLKKPGNEDAQMLLNFIYDRLNDDNTVKNDLAKADDFQHDNPCFVKYERIL